MNKFKTISIIFVCIFLIILFVIFKKQKCKGLACLDFENYSSFSLSDTYEDSDTVFRALYQQGQNDFVRLEVKSSIEQSDSEKILPSKINHLNDIFENSISPYPGEISVQVTCADKYKPKFSKTEFLSYFTGYLNDRLQFGSCSEDQVKNQGVIAFFYCPNQKKFYQFEYIVPVNKDEDRSQQIRQFIETVRCR